MTGWILRRSDGTTKPLAVPKRTQEQREQARRNAQKTPPPLFPHRRVRPS